MVGLPSRTLWPSDHVPTSYREILQVTPFTPHPRLSSSFWSNFFFMIILQSLLKFKKDFKSGTPVVVGNDHVVCVIVAIEPDSCTNAKPVRVPFSRSDFSVWGQKKKIPTEAQSLDCCCEFVFLACSLVCFYRKNIFWSVSKWGIIKIICMSIKTFYFFLKHKCLFSSDDCRAKAWSECGHTVWS